MAEILGTAANDTLTGTADADIVRGLAGADQLSGAGGNDRLEGGDDNDVLDGGEGDDLLFGGEGSDYLRNAFGTGGNDQFYGEGGDDRLDVTRFSYNSGPASYRLEGGAGNDVISYFRDSNPLDSLIVRAGDGNDSVTISGASFIELDAGAGADSVQISASTGDYRISLGTEADTLFLLGGGPSAGPAARITIFDFAPGASGDRIDLSDYLDNALIGWKKSTNPFDTGYLRLTGYGAYTVLQVDRDGDGSGFGFADLITFTDLAAASLTAENFSGYDPGYATADAGADGDDVLVGDGDANRIEGLGGNDQLYGAGGDDVLDGGAGEDLLDGQAGRDTMVGGAGNDTFVVDDSGDRAVEFDEAGGIDTVLSSADYALGARVENLTLTGSTAVHAEGNNLDNRLEGNAGANLLNGGSGADTMIGAGGDDIYVVDDAGDRVVEASASGGIDTVYTTVDFALGDHVENLVLENPPYGDQPYNGTGNALANRITGNNSDNRLDGGLGADILEGGIGNDTYVVDDAGDQVIETAETTGVGIDYVDTVESSVDFTLGDYVENLVLTGTAAIRGSGNDLNNRLTGNAAANVLDGKAGADTMVGGAGDDVYYGDTSIDQVIEEAGGGWDILTTSVSRSLAANVEQLVLTGEAAWGFGNALDNVILGNGAANLLRGLDGNDTLDGSLGGDRMEGGLGNDTYKLDDLADEVVEAAGEGTDSVLVGFSYTLGANVENLTLTGAAAINGTGNGLANDLYGNAAANRLDGGAGADRMCGGAGDDVYAVDDAGDQAIELAGGGSDQVRSSVSFTLGDHVEKLVLVGTAAIDAAGNGLANALLGNSAANRLDGGLGADAMAGGAGDDTYIVDNAGDRVTENAGEGTDTVRSSVGFALTGQVENLVLTGAAAINAVGNGLANSLAGNAAANLINGGGGADLMAGGAGNDIYIVDHAGDVASELAGEGSDLVKSTVTFTLGEHVEKLTLRGASAIDGTGNGQANTIAGNEAANRLDGGAGADKLIGYGGNDTYVVDNIADQVIETSSGGGSDTVLASVSFTLGDHVESLWLTGEAATSGTGNDLANFLYGQGSGDNLLDGGRGNDALSGGAGNDELHGGLGLDSLEGGAGADRFVFDKPLGAGNVDMILDFTRGSDTIVLENALFRGLAAGALNANALAIGTAAGDADDRLVYDPATGRLWYDADGTGAAAQILFATLDNPPATLAASDFAVI